MTYRPKATIQAFQWSGGPDQTEDPEWACERIKSGEIWFEDDVDAIIMIFRHSNGTWAISPGEWLILHPDGSLEGMGDRLFHETYEPAT